MLLGMGVGSSQSAEHDPAKQKCVWVAEDGELSGDCHGQGKPIVLLVQMDIKAPS